MSALTGDQAGATVDQEHLRQWTCVFRLRFLGANPASVLASMLRDDLEAGQGNNDPGDDDDEPEIIDLTGDSDDEPSDSDDED